MHWNNKTMFNKSIVQDCFIRIVKSVSIICVLRASLGNRSAYMAPCDTDVIRRARLRRSRFAGAEYVQCAAV